MSDIQINSTDIQHKDPSLGGKSVSARNVQYWNYEWEKAYVEQENANRKSVTTQQSNATCEDCATLNHAQSKQGELHSEYEQYHHSNNDSNGIDVSLPMVSQDASAMIKTTTQHPALKPSIQPGMPMSSSGNASNTPVVNNSMAKNGSSANLSSLQWHIVPQVKASKTGLYIYKSDSDQIKVWLRDRSLSKQKGLALISELRKILSHIGINLVEATLNGQLITKNTSNDSNQIVDEVVL